MRERFSALKTAQDVADLLDTDKATLNYHLYICPDKKRYATFSIPKRSGGKRKIKAPISPIKILQRKLNQVLQVVYKQRKPVHGFIRKRNIISNAKRHVNKRWVLNIDFKDFFPTVSFQRIRGMFLKNPYSLDKAAATVLAQLCCCDGTLPQGAPTSPIITNMICSKLDNQLNRMARRNGCIYTRYVDDLTFSTNESSFPEKVAKLNSNGKTIVGDDIDEIIRKNWFTINDKKIKLRRYYMRQEVTGLTVNKKVNVRRKYVKQIRAMLHCWERYGLADAQKEYIKRHQAKKYRHPSKNVPEYKHILQGKLSFLRDVIGDTNPVYLRYYKQFQRLYLLEFYNVQRNSTSNTRRGLILEKLINRLFEINGVEVVKSFRRNTGGEQIDGACRVDSLYYLIECKWQAKLSGTRDTDAFVTKASRSGGNTRGIFISINGWSKNVPKLLKQNPDKNVILMDGSDIEHVLKHRVNLIELMRAKNKHFSLKAEPYYGAEKLL